MCQNGTRTTQSFDYFTITHYFLCTENSCHVLSFSLWLLEFPLSVLPSAVIWLNEIGIFPNHLQKNVRICNSWQMYFLMSPKAPESKELVIVLIRYITSRCCRGPRSWCLCCEGGNHLSSQHALTIVHKCT